MNISEPFIRRPVATTLLMTALAFVGLVSFPFLPVAPLPQVDFPTIQVTANFQGASAETMASSVAAPLERQFAQIPGVSQLTSLSALGATTIVIQFDLNRNIDSAGQDVQAAITVANKTLPREMTAPPSYKKVNPADSPIIMFSVRSETMPLTLVDDYADLFLAQQISQVPGVAQVSIFGDRTPAIRIQVDPAKLAASGVTLEEIRSILVTSTSNAAKGTINTDKLSFTIAANDQITEADKFNDVILAYRNGAPIRVRDVGQAVPEEVDRTVAAYQNNQPGVILAVFKQPGANVIETVDQIKDQLPQLTARIPPAIEVKTILDRTTTIRASVRGRGVHARAHHCPGGDGHPPVPAQFLGHPDPEHHRAAGAARVVRGHVPAQLQSRQPLADGADHRGRLRGRRCHRGGREYLPPHRARDPAVRGRDQGLARDRLHRAVDQRLADRGVHSAAAHGRDHRPPVPRIRLDRHGLDRGLGAGVAHARADAVLALHDARVGRARPHLPRDRGRLQRRCCRSIGARSTSCCATSSSPCASSSPPWR